VKEGEYLSKDNQSPRDHTDVLQWSKAKIDEFFSNVFMTTIQRGCNKIKKKWLNSGWTANKDTSSQQCLKMSNCKTQPTDYFPPTPHTNTHTQINETISQSFL